MLRCPSRTCFLPSAPLSWSPPCCESSLLRRPSDDNCPSRKRQLDDDCATALYCTTSTLTTHSLISHFSRRPLLNSDSCACSDRSDASTPTRWPASCLSFLPQFEVSLYLLCHWAGSRSPPFCRHTSQLRRLPHYSTRKSHNFATLLSLQACTNKSIYHGCSSTFFTSAPRSLALSLHVSGLRNVS